MESEKRLFVDVNVIQTVPPSCINRDDTNSPKTSVYGGVRRARVSSQSWKRAMRVSFRSIFDESELAVRTTKIVELVANKIKVLDPSIPDAESIMKAKDILAAAGISFNVKEKKKKTQDEESVAETKALFFMSTKQAENLAALAVEDNYDKKVVKAALNAGNGVEIALFGRMVAESADYNVDASSQVAHAISTHKVDNEYDFYTAVDEMNQDDESGAGMMGTVEFNSSTLYRYATVAVHDLFKQVEDREVLAETVEGFARAFIMSMPTGKENTFANRTIPDAVIIAIRGDQPVNLVGAFETPVVADRTVGGHVEGSIRKLVEYESSTHDFVDVPLKTILIGRGLESMGEMKDIRSAMSELKGIIEKEF